MIGLDLIYGAFFSYSARISRCGDRRHIPGIASALVPVVPEYSNTGTGSMC